MQKKKYIRKGCALYVVHVTNFREGNKPKQEDFPILQDFRYVILNEILGLPPMRDIDFMINLIFG